MISIVALLMLAAKPGLDLNSLFTVSSIEPCIALGNSYTGLLGKYSDGVHSHAELQRAITSLKAANTKGALGRTIYDAESKTLVWDISFHCRPPVEPPGLQSSHRNAIW